MKEKSDFVSSLVALLNRGVDFVIYALPGNDSTVCLTDDGISPVKSSRKFTVTKWDGSKYYILDRIDRPSPVYANDKPSPVNHGGQYAHMRRYSTTWPEYEAWLKKVIGLLAQADGKVVISRLKVIEDRRIDFAVIAAAIYEMFSNCTDTFRAVYFTQATGAWCVCSPELLLHVDKHSGELHTVALAGTRRRNDGGLWDDKNKREHAYVVRHIEHVLKSMGIIPVTAATGEMTTGSLMHLITRISGAIDLSVTLNSIVDRLHPTPAICGYPTSRARDIIEETERHDRECYGGYISMEDDGMYLAHVNLRCFAFAPGCCCFWGGGGILADSDAATEWEEAASKIDATLAFISRALPQD